MAHHPISGTLTFQPISAGEHIDAFLIQTRCHVFPWSESMFSDCLSPPYFAYQLFCDNRVVGYYVGLNVAGEATLMDIGLDTSLRGKGLGNILLTHFVEQCKKRQCEEIWLEVRTSNSTAIALYDKFGFTCIETRKNYYQSVEGREDALIMKRGLLDQQGRLIE